jgi:hypothetical protein
MIWLCIFYLFIIGDEDVYSTISSEHVKKFTGDSLQTDIPIETIFAELKEKFHVFYLNPKNTSHFGNKRILKQWVDQLGQNVIPVENTSQISEVIASLIGLHEGVIEASGIVSDLVDIGVDKDIAKNVSDSVSSHAKNLGIVKKNNASVEGVIAVPKAKKLKRL